MTFQKLLWLFPVAVTLHNAEEAIWMPGWQLRHAAQMPLNPPRPDEIRVVLLLLTLAAFALTSLSTRKGPESVWTYLTFGYVIAMLINVFVPHLPAAILFRGYAPGVVTAVLINLPVMTVLAVRALRERWVDGRRAVAFGVGVPVFLGGMIMIWLTALG